MRKLSIITIIILSITLCSCNNTQGISSANTVKQVDTVEQTDNKVEEVIIKSDSYISRAKQLIEDGTT